MYISYVPDSRTLAREAELQGLLESQSLDN